jgi:hypothetical protein
MSELDRAVAAARLEKAENDHIRAEYRADALRRLVAAKRDFFAHAPASGRLSASGSPEYDGRAAYNMEVRSLWLLPGRTMDGNRRRFRLL